MTAAAPAGRTVDEGTVPLIEARGLTRHFKVGGAIARKTLHAVDDANFTIGDREIVALRWFAELTEAETAAALGCPVGTVKSRSSRALARLRTLLGTEGEA